MLNRSPLVNHETRTRIEQAIHSLDFAPSAQARGLATGRSFLIGLIHNDRNALVLDAVQRGIVSEATARRCELVVHPTPTGADAIGDVIDFARRSKVDGMVVMPPVSGIDGIAEALAAAAVPAVALSAVPIEGFAALMISNERRAAADVARHLIDLGHRCMAMINGPTGVVSASERRTGFGDALRQAGLSLAGEAEGDYDFASGLIAAERLLDLTPRPTAIFAANDIMAAALLKVAAVRGIAVPKHLSVVGFDGSMLASMLSPALTTVRRPLLEMARMATERLLDLVEGDRSSASENMIVELQLEIGESCAPVS